MRYTLAVRFPEIEHSLLTEQISKLTVENVFSWSRLTPLNSVKVVVLGQVSWCGHG